MTVPAAEGDERAVEAVVPGSVLVHVPEAVLIRPDFESTKAEEGRFRLFSVAIFRFLYQINVCGEKSRAFSSQCDGYLVYF